MSFDYQPLTEEECTKNRYKIAPDGIYSFVVVDKVDKISQNGFPLRELTLEFVNHHEGTYFKVWDKLLAMPNMEWKNRHFCQSTGTIEEYENRQFSSLSCVGLKGFASIATKKGDQREDSKGGGFYPDRNIVKDYVLKTTSTSTYNAPLQKVSNGETLNEDIPF